MLVAYQLIDRDRESLSSFSEIVAEMVIIPLFDSLTFLICLIRECYFEILLDNRTTISDDIICEEINHITNAIQKP